MRPSATPLNPRKQQCAGQSGIQILLLAAICIILGFAAGAWWVHHASTPTPVSTGNDSTSATSGQQTVAPPDSPEIAPQRVRAPGPPPKPAAPATIEDVKRLVPNYASVSLDEGIRALRAKSITEYLDAMKEIESQLKSAQERLTQAQNGGTDAEQQAAMKQLQQVQASQTARIQEIAAKNQAQLEAFRQIKTAGP